MAAAVEQGWRGILTRGIRPEGPVVPNDNDPAEVPPATVGPPSATPGDPHGVQVEAAGEAGLMPPARITPSPWSGWPAEWGPPAWSGAGWSGGGLGGAQVTDTAWACLDLNASVLASMPPYLVGAGTGTDQGWLGNPDPDLYSSWDEFAKQLFWDYQLGEAFVLATASYATGWPARFHVVPPWLVNVEMAGGRRQYSIGGLDVTEDVCHLRYQSRTDDARGHGPLEVGAGRLALEGLLLRYVSGFAASGGVPSSILTHPDELNEGQAQALQAAWIKARLEAAGAPAVLSGGVTWEATQVSPGEAGGADLLERTQSRVAILLGVPPFLVGLPSGGDSMTYSNVSSLFDYHWRASLRPKAQAVMAGLSGFLLARGVAIELNRDAYVQAAPRERAETYATLHAIEDESGRALSVAEIRAAERLDVAGAAGLAATGEVDG